VITHTSCPRSLDASVDGAPSLTGQTSRTSETPCDALVSSITIILSLSSIASWSARGVLVGIGIGIDEDGGCGGVWGGEEQGSGG
jgi:hypothetical protein